MDPKINPDIIVEFKSHYGGEELTYVVSEQKEPLKKLTGRETLSRRHIEALKELGFSFFTKASESKRLSSISSNIRKIAHLFKISGLSILHSGKEIDITGDISIKGSDRKKYSVKESYFDTLGDLTNAVIESLNKAGLTPVDGDKVWVGTFTGSMASGDEERFTIDLVKDGKNVKNSKLILNIQKDNQRKKPYELNSYLS